MKNDNLFIGNYLFRLFCGHINVFVVGKNEHNFARSCTNGFNNIFRAWVHRLPAAYDNICSEVFKNGSDTVARGNADKPVFFLGCGGNSLFLFVFLLGFARRKLRMLFFHIFNFDLGKNTVFKAFGKDFARVVGMNMEFDEILIVNENAAVAAIHNKFAECVYLFFCFMNAGNFIDDTLGAICKLDVLCIKGRKVRLSRFGRRTRMCGNLAFSVKNGKHTFKQNTEAHTARVNNFCLFQRGKHIGSLCQCVFCVCKQLGKELGICNTRIGDFRRSVGTKAHNGKNRALCRFADCLIRRLNTALESSCKICGRRFGKSFQFFCNPSEKQRKDNAGVTSAAAKKCGSDLIRTFGQTAVEIINGILARLHGKAHVRACISVGNGKYIEFIYFILKICDVICRRNYHTAVNVSVYHISYLK